MREILFRGKRKDNGQWIYGDLRQYSEKSKRIFSYEIKSGFDVIPETVGQYAGVNDESNIEIFEGDIIEILLHLFTPEEPRTGVIKFKNGSFVVDDIYSSCGHNELSCIFDEISCNREIEEWAIFRVIGNIYDNPELVKE